MACMRLAWIWVSIGSFLGCTKHYNEDTYLKSLWHLILHSTLNEIGSDAQANLVGEVLHLCTIPIVTLSNTVRLLQVKEAGHFVLLWYIIYLYYTIYKTILYIYNYSILSFQKMWSQVPTMVHAQENSARQYTLIAGGDGSVRASELRRKCWILYI